MVSPRPRRALAIGAVFGAAFAVSACFQPGPRPSGAESPARTATAESPTPPTGATPSAEVTPATKPTPVVAAAGDIACPPGARPGRNCQHAAVSDAINADTAVGTVLALGDLQYPKGTLSAVPKVIRHDIGGGSRTRPGPSQVITSTTPGARSAISTISGRPPGIGTKAITPSMSAAGTSSPSIPNRTPGVMVRRSPGSKPISRPTRTGVWRRSGTDHGGHPGRSTATPGGWRPS